MKTKVYLNTILIIISFNCLKAYSQDNIKFTLSRGNYAYAGVQNPFIFSFKTSKNSNLLFKSDVGKILVSNGKYNFQTSSLNSALISVFKISNSDTTEIYQQVVKTLLFPTPTIVINEQKLESTIIKKEVFQNAEKLDVSMGTDLIGSEDFFIVKKFQLIISTEDGLRIFNSENNFFTDEMKLKMNNLKSGDLLSIENIVIIGIDATNRFFNPFTIQIK